MSSTTLWFGVLSPRSIKQRPLSPNTWTCVGALAIPLWATWPSLAIQTRDIPPFESLAIMFFFGWLVFNRLPRTDLADREPSSTRSWLPAVIYGLALAGDDACFILATHRIPAAQANLISFLWPVMIVVFGAVCACGRSSASFWDSPARRFSYGMVGYPCLSLELALR
jgi:drug/metabolite transporter (DMT)-like permease